MSTSEVSLQPGDTILIKRPGQKEYLFGRVLYDTGTIVHWYDLAGHLNVAYKRHTVRISPTPIKL